LNTHFFLYAVAQFNAVALIVTFGEDSLASLWQSAVVLVGLNLAFTL